MNETVQNCLEKNFSKSELESISKNELIEISSIFYIPNRIKMKKVDLINKILDFQNLSNEEKHIIKRKSELISLSKIELKKICSSKKLKNYSLLSKEEIIDKIIKYENINKEKNEDNKEKSIDYLNNKNKKEIDIIAKELNIPYRTKLKKEELISIIINNKKSKNQLELEKKSIKDIRKFSKTLNFKFIYKTKKLDLIDNILKNLEQYKITIDDLENNSDSIKELLKNNEKVKEEKNNEKVKEEKNNEEVKEEKNNEKVKEEKNNEEVKEEKNKKIKIKKFNKDKVLFNDIAMIYNLENISKILFHSHIKNETLDYTKNLLIDNLNKFNNIKYQINIKVKYFNTLKDIYQEVYHNTSISKILIMDDIDNSLENLYNILNDIIDKFISNGSGWVFVDLLEYKVLIAQYTPLSGSSYIELPTPIKNKKACINVKNSDNKCFKWALLSALYPVNKHSDRVKSYKKHFDKIIDTNIDYPVKISDIKKFEKLNNIYINCYQMDIKKNSYTIYPLIISDEPQKAINILRFSSLLGNNIKSHYVYIKHFSKLFYSYSRHKCKKHFCLRCLHPFSNEKILNNHLVDCNKGEAIKTILPNDKNNILKFKNFSKKIRHPFVIYSDFESITKKINENMGDNSIKYQKHKACGFNITIISMDPDFQPKPITYRGKDCYVKFIEELSILEKLIMKRLKNVKPIIMSNKDIENFNNSKKCHLCENLFSKDTIKVRDHDHITGEFRGAACNSCNINCKSPNFIPVIFHNLKNYDSHLILQAISKELDNKNGYNKIKNMKAIPLNNEKLISFSFNNIRFIDSFQFLNCSLETLISNLKSDKEQKLENKFKITNKYLSSNKSNDLLENNKFKNSLTSNKFKNSLEKLDLITKKGVYPYDYMDNFNRFNETKLPLKSDFYSKLNDEDITDEEYERANKIWDIFNIKNMGEYHDLYLKSDVYLLADVFETFRDLCLEHYKIDPVHYYTLPGFSWDGMLLNTNCKLELFTDINMYNYVEYNIKGGISNIVLRYAKANNKYLKDYNPNIENSFIMYYDANNLYGDAMSKKLPYSNFEWITFNELCNSLKNNDLKNSLKINSLKNELKNDLTFNKSKDLLKNNDLKNVINSLDIENDISYIIDYDLDIPNKLHDYLNEYPPVESILIKHDNLSNYNKELVEKFNIKEDTINKLVPNLNNKTNYVSHIKLLKLYLSLGCKITKINRILKFKQKAFLKPYIDFNTRKRANAKNDFEKDFYKLMNNSIFGKTMENVRKHIDSNFVINDQQAKRKINNPRCKNIKIFSKNLGIVEYHKKEVKLNKPIYIGLCVLDLSKVLMYNFHYNVIKKRYKDNAKLIFTDTDSLTYHIKTEDIYDDMLKNKDLYDFSDYPKDHKCYNVKNKKVIGKFKDELNGKQIKEVVALRPKTYSVLIDDDIQKSTCKGVKKNVKNKLLNHEKYLECLNFKKEINISQNTIRSIDHNIYSITTEKIGLSCYDNKRYILDDGKNTLSYGHFSIIDKNQ